MVRLNDLVCNEKYSFTGGPFGSNLKVSDFTKSGVRVIQLNNIEDIYFNDENKVFVSDYKASVLSTCNAFPGDIVFAKMMPAGRACILPDIYKRYLLGSDAIRCKLDKHKVDTTFFLESVNRESFRNLVNSKTAGSTRKRIGLPELKNLPLLIPEKKEQEKIGNLFKLLEEKNNLLNSKISTIKKYKEGLLNRFFTFEKLDASIRDYATLVDGNSFQSNDYKEGGSYKVITISNITGNRFFDIQDSTKSLDQIPKYLDSSQIIKTGDLLITMTGNIGRTSFSNQNNCLLNQRVCKIITNTNLEKEVIYQLTKTSKFERSLNIKSVGAAQKNISKNDICKFRFDSNSFNAKQIMTLKLFDFYIETLNSKRKLLSKVKKYLLSKMFI